MFHCFLDSSNLSADGHTLVIASEGDTAQEYNHIARVLRMKQGEEISVSMKDGGTVSAPGMETATAAAEYRFGIEEITAEAITCSLRFVKQADVELPSKITLFQGLPKSDKMELIIQKAVELGCSRIVPVETGRCVVKLDAKKAAHKKQRWQAIAEAAAKQSRRGIVPEICMPMPFREAISLAEQECDVRLIPYELAEGMATTRELVEAIRPGQSVGVFIGPEGGFEEKEITLATQAGISPITMGRRILRTETAGFTILSWLMYHLEDCSAE